MNGKRLEFERVIVFGCLVVEKQDKDSSYGEGWWLGGWVYVVSV